MTRQKRHNPEKKAFRGRSYKKGGARIVDLRALPAMDEREIRDATDGESILEAFGLDNLGRLSAAEIVRALVIKHEFGEADTRIDAKKRGPRERNKWDDKLDELADRANAPEATPTGRSEDDGAARLLLESAERFARAKRAYIELATQKERAALWCAETQRAYWAERAEPGADVARDRWARKAERARTRLLEAETRATKAFDAAVEGPPQRGGPNSPT